MSNRTECIINSVRQAYDACSSKSLSESIQYYEKTFVYIGSGNGDIYINGKLNHFEGVCHFFVRGKLKSQRIEKIKKLYKT